MAFALVLAACSPSPGPPVQVALEKPGARPTTISLERAEAFEVLIVAQMLLEEPLFVDATAIASMRCIALTVKEPNPLPPVEAATKIFDALHAQGLQVVHSKGMWLVLIDGMHPPKACAPEGRATAASEAPDAGAQAPMDDDAVLQEVLRSIREISPSEHAVTQRGIDLFLEHPSMLLKQVRIVPERIGGLPAAVRLFGVRADGVLGRLGFENGDRIETIMGKPVGTPEQALDVYATVRTAKVVEIEIDRRGAAAKLVVRVE